MAEFTVTRIPVNELYDMLHFPLPEHERATLGVVDDQWWAVEPLVEGLVRRGFRCLGFDIDYLAHATDSQERELAEHIAVSGADLMIVDSGLGYVDSSKLLRRLREHNMLTMLLTGARETEENTDIADQFVRKPVLVASLAALLVKCSVSPRDKKNHE